MTSVSRLPVPPTRCGWRVAASKMRLAPAADVGGQPLPRRHAGEAGGEAAERRGPGRDRAAIGAAAIGVERLVQHGLDTGADFDLHRMIAIDVVRGRHAECFGDGEHAGVLARAVVVNGRWRLTAVAQFLAGDREGGRVGAAFEIGDAEADVAEERASPP